MIVKALVAAAAVTGATMLALPATAMPIAKLTDNAVGNVEQVRWVCGYRRCWWAPGRAFARHQFYVGPRFRHHRWRHW
jgi:hypothetical protein